MRIFPFVLFALLLIGTVNAALVQQWNRTYDGGNKDAIVAAAVDSQNNVIVTGYTMYGLSPSSGKDILTIKYASDGNVLWSKVYHISQFDMAYGIAVDAQNNIFVVGGTYNSGSPTSSDFLTIKYDANGNLLWAKNWSSNGNQYDEARGVAIDAQNNIVVAGITQYAASPSSGTDFLTIKYDQSGNALWIKNYSATISDNAWGVKTDSQSNIIITGYAMNAVPGTNTQDFLTVKYNPNGNLLWAKNYSTIYDEYAYGVAIDSQGYMYVAGIAQNSVGPASKSDFFVIKYTPEGYIVWINGYGGASSEYGRQIAVDSHDNLLIVGGEMSDNNNPATANLLFMKITSGGNLLWFANYSGANEDTGTGIAVDSQGKIIVAGYSNNSVSPASQFDFIILDYLEDNVPPALTTQGGGTYASNSTAIITISGNEALANCIYSINSAAPSAMGKISDAGYVASVSGTPGVNATKNVAVTCNDLAGNPGTASLVISFVYSPASPLPQNITPNATQNQTQKVCGNHICETGETATTCSADCNQSINQQQTVCGNHICETGETIATCPADCNQSSNQPNGNQQPGNDNQLPGTGDNAPAASAFENEAAATSSILPGVPGIFTFDKFYVSTISIETASGAENVKVTARKLDSTPAIAIKPIGNVYKFIEITTENLTDEKVQQGTVVFKVEKSWLTSNSYDASTVRLHRYAGGQWTPLITAKTGEESGNYVYTAQTPAFSTFAITASTASQCNVQCPPGMVVNSTTCACQYAVSCVESDYFDTVTGMCKPKAEGEFPFLWIALLAVGASFAVVAVLFITKGRGAGRSVLIPPAQSPTGRFAGLPAQTSSETKAAQIKPAAPVQPKKLEQAKAALNSAEVPKPKAGLKQAAPKPKAEPEPKAAHISKDVCPKCGTKAPGKFCTKCGAKK